LELLEEETKHNSEKARGLKITALNRYMIILTCILAVCLFFATIYTARGYITTVESTNSYIHGMEELELSARFSLKSIVLARMVMLGLGNFVVLAAVMSVLKNQINITYVLAPYFLTAGGGLYIARNLRGKDSTFACFALAALVCVLQLYLPWQFKFIMEPENTWIWVSLCVIGIVVTVRESYRTIRMTEDLVWN